jgi:hypothetical protein
MSELAELRQTLADNAEQRRAARAAGDQARYDELTRERKRLTDRWAHIAPPEAKRGYVRKEAPAVLTHTWRPDLEGCDKCGGQLFFDYREGNVQCLQCSWDYEVDYVLRPGQTRCACHGLLVVVGGQTVCQRCRRVWQLRRSLAIPDVVELECEMALA